MLGRIVQRWANRSHEKELNEFVAHLAAADDNEVAFTVVVASEVRHVILDKFGWDLLYPNLLQNTVEMIQLEVIQMVRQLQKEGKFVAAAALMVWAHSLRASGPMASGELRSLARRMWAELSRGFPGIEKAAADVRTTFGIVPRLDRAIEFPEGLTPRPGKEI